MSFRRHRRPVISPPLDAQARLWLLRLLVPLNGMRRSTDHFCHNRDSVAQSLGIAQDTDEDDPAAAQKLRAELRRLHAKAEAERPANLRGPKLLSDNLGRLGKLVGLSPLEQRLLMFAVLLQDVAALNCAADALGELGARAAVRVLALLLDAEPRAVQAALSAEAALNRSGLLCLRRGNHQLTHKLELLSDGLVDRLSSEAVAPLDLLRDTLLRSTPPQFGLDDFPHLQPSLNLLMPWLRSAFAQRRPGVNVLLHGAPGTGKNQLAKAIAHELGVEMFEVSSEDEDGDPVDGEQRLRTFRMGQALLEQGPALLLFDEVQDVFSGGSLLRAAPVAGRKAWLNRMLEQNPVPALWLTNSIHSMDPAFLRRFDMVVEVPIPPVQQRRKIIEAVCGELLPATELDQLAGAEHLAPAVVARAATVLRAVAPALDSAEGVASGMRLLVNQSLEAQGHAPLQRVQPAVSSLYDPDCTNADTPLDEVLAGLRAAPAARLCLYGPPGTGKSEWARWLAQQLGRKLLVRRGSDLLDMWLGATERNIARAFSDAQAEGAVLLIDEIDGFLADRRTATRSWELTQVNELLTQMERFDGLFIASTNLVDSLDPAAARRFDLKLRFDPMRAEQAERLLRRHIELLQLGEIDAAALGKLANLPLLTPGDFATVARQHRFRPFASAAAFVAALVREQDFKQGGPARCIGFSA